MLKRKPECRKEGCPLMGQLHPKCIGHTSVNNERVGGGQPCGNFPMRGLHVCSTHGGMNPNARKAAAKNVSEAKARDMMLTLGQPINIAPSAALLEEVRWTAGHVAWLRQRVQELEPDAMVFGTTMELTKQATEFPGTDTTREAQPPVWYALYERERAHLVRVCAAAVSANIEQKRVELEIEKGQLVAGMLRRVLSAAFELIVATLRAAGVSDAAIVDALREAWSGFLSTKVPDELRAMGQLETDDGGRHE